MFWLATFDIVVWHKHQSMLVSWLNSFDHIKRKWSTMEWYTSAGVEHCYIMHIVYNTQCGGWLTSCQSSYCIRARGSAVYGIIWIISITQEPQDIAAVGWLGQLLDSCQPMQWTGITVLFNVAMEIPTHCKRSGTYKAKNLNTDMAYKGGIRYHNS